jgi:hypothetical protein
MHQTRATLVSSIRESNSPRCLIVDTFTIDKIQLSKVCPSVDSIRLIGFCLSNSRLSTSRHLVQEQVDPSVEKIKFKSQKGLKRMDASVFVIQKPFRIHDFPMAKPYFLFTSD